MGRLTRPGTTAVVVGGGIAGLAAAYRLSQADGTEQVVVLEAEPRWGGKILTHRVDGFVMEAGAESLMTSRPRALALAAELGLSDRLRPVDGRHRGTYVLRHGRLHPVPEGMGGLAPSQAGSVLRSSLLSPAAKGRMALEYLVPARRDDADESLESFVSRRLGRQAYRRLAEPLAAAVFAADPSRLSVSVLPHLRAAELEHGGLIRAMLRQRGQARRRASTGPEGQVAPMVTPAGGMAELVHAIVERLGPVRLREATTAVAVERGNPGYVVHAVGPGGTSALPADAVVLAVPPTAAAGLVAGLHPGLSEALGGAELASTVTVNLGFQERDVHQRLRGHGYLVPRSEGRTARACTWTSAKFPGHAPPEHALVRVSLGGAGRPVLDHHSDEALLDLARAELRTTVGVDADPVAARVHRWTRLIPVYAVGHGARVAHQQRLLSTLPGLTVAGSGYHGAGVPDCIVSGEAAAERVLSSLTPVDRHRDPVS